MVIYRSVNAEEPYEHLLWILQIALALHTFAGGAYKILKFDEIANMPAIAALPRAGWGALGVFEMVCAVLLIVPAAMKRMPSLAVAVVVAAVATFVTQGSSSMLQTQMNVDLIARRLAI